MIAAGAKAAKKAQGPAVLVVAPTRELAGQTHRVLKLLLPNTGVKGSLLANSTAAGTDFRKVDFLVATPLLLVQVIGHAKVRTQT